jgi:hypothetical protein
MTYRAVFSKLSLLIICAFSFSPARNVPAQDQRTLSQLTIDSDTTARLLFGRLNANYVLPPLIFRVGDEGSPNLNTAPVDKFGRAPYISLLEMKSLVRQLEADRLVWKVSANKTPIEPFEKIWPDGNLSVTVYATNGMATSTISPKQFCKALSQLNDVITTKRAHWEFEYFRRGCSCIVPGYKSDAYPNDR